MGRLNLAYGIGENIGWQPSGGFGLLRETIFYNFGINVHYYARVNFSQFETIINTLGGVDIGVDCAYQDFYPVDDFDPNGTIEDNYYLRTLDVGYYTFNGFDALWYARTRKVTDDFDRGRRQQQLLRAMWRKARDTGLLSNLPSLWGELTEVVDTNVPFDTMLGLLPYVLNLDISKIENFHMIRTYHTTPCFIHKPEQKNMSYTKRIAQELNLQSRQVESAVQLLSDGNTIPFIARYRKEMTFSLDELQLRQIEQKYDYYQAVDTRRIQVISIIEKQGNLTKELHQQLLSADTLVELEDLYQPYKVKRKTRATKAIDAGLKPLADKLLRGSRGDLLSEAKRYLCDAYPTTEDVLSGVRDIVAQVIANDTEIRQRVRQKAMIGLTAVLDIAKPGDRILMVSYGSGAGSDAFDLQVTDRINQKPNGIPTTQDYIQRRTHIDYAVYTRYRGKLKE